MWSLPIRSQIDQGMENPLINLSNKLHRAFSPQGHQTCNISTYSHQGPCITPKIPMPLPGKIRHTLHYMPGSVSLLFGETNVSSLPTLHERTRCRGIGPSGEPTLPSMHSPVSVVGNREKRCWVERALATIKPVAGTPPWYPCRRSSRGQFFGRMNGYPTIVSELLLCLHGIWVDG